jgi:hypothetical protein
MITCGRVEKLFSAYLEGELQQQLHQKIQEHIRFCSDCYEKEHSLRKLLGLTADLPSEQPSPEFTDRVLKKMEAGEARPLKSLHRFVTLPAVRRWVWAMPAAAAALLLILALNFGLINWQAFSTEDKPIASFETAPPEKVSIENIVPEGPVEFVMDNWDPALLQYNWTGNPENSSQFRPSLAGSEPGQENWRVYVMPVVNSQTTSYQSRRPY